MYSLFFGRSIIDNEAVVSILNLRTSWDVALMHLLRSLLMAAARHNFVFSAVHIAGRCNRIADALSRFHWQVFQDLAPDANPRPVHLPLQLLGELFYTLHVRRIGDVYPKNLSFGSTKIF